MSKAKFNVGDKVILTEQYPDGDNIYFTRGGLKLGEKYTISTVDVGCSNVDWCAGTFVYGLQDTGLIVSEPMLSPTEQVNQLDNTKIDVKAYAVQHGLTLEQAHNEIQPWLFEQGYTWIGCKEVDYSDKSYLFLSYGDSITWDNTEGYFDEHEHKQIFLDRNVSIVLTIKEPVDTITINDVVYNKQDVLKAIGFADVKSL